MKNQEIKLTPSRFNTLRQICNAERQPSLFRASAREPWRATIYLLVGHCPLKAAILVRINPGSQFVSHFNKEQTPLPTNERWRLVFYEHIDESNRAGAEPQLAGDQRAHASGGVLHDGNQRGHRP